MKRLLALVLTIVLLAGCAPAARDDGKVHILCTTYPVYLFTTAVTEGDPDVTVELMVKEQVSCLHDYTLTVEDMKAVERADVIMINGAGLERFLDSALRQVQVPVIDCSAGIALLPASGHHHHDGDEDDPGHEDDPHLWMDPDRAGEMVANIARGLTGCTGRQYSERAGGVIREILALNDVRLPAHTAPLITFHDGFEYFSHAYGLDLLKSIEEEEGAEASARELSEIIDLVRENDIPAIFVEKNGARRSADVIARETGCQVCELDMIMSGEGSGIQPYIQAMEQNLQSIRGALTREEVAP